MAPLAPRQAVLSTLCAILTLSLATDPQNHTDPNASNVFARYITAKASRQTGQLITKVASQRAPLAPNATDPDTGLTEEQMRALILNQGSSGKHAHGGNHSHPHKSPTHTSGHTFVPFVHKQKYNRTFWEDTVQAKKHAGAAAPSASSAGKSSATSGAAAAHHSKPNDRAHNHADEPARQPEHAQHQQGAASHGDHHTAHDPSLLDPDEEAESEDGPVTEETNPQRHTAHEHGAHHPSGAEHPAAGHANESSRFGRAVIALLVSAVLVSLVVTLSSRRLTSRDPHVNRLLRKLGASPRSPARSV